jgi:hypothetical protein
MAQVRVLASTCEALTPVPSTRGKLFVLQISKCLGFVGPEQGEALGIKMAWVLTLSLGRYILSEPLVS